MCRILVVRADEPFNIASQLTPFARLSRQSREYQGHGWGCSWLNESDDWQHYHHIQPVWEDDPSQFDQTRLLLVHARSAFRDEGIAVENNMPFTDGDTVFIFNGELRGVRIKSEGRIGAEKIYNYFRRLDNGDRLAALRKAVSIINKRTSYVRAMNMVVADKSQQLISTTYSEDPDYFQMVSHRSAGMSRVCSAPFAGESGWQPIDNHSTYSL
ncbi:MAG: hypothetical protein AAF404_12285 [Pseudomonadota bacterium]